MRIKKENKPKLIVVVNKDGIKDGINVSASTHIKNVNKAVNKIKRPEPVIYNQFWLAGGNAGR